MSEPSFGISFFRVDRGVRSLWGEDRGAVKRRGDARQRPGKGAGCCLLGGCCYFRGVEFGILGPLAVWKDGRELPLGGAKQRAVLAVLVLRANEVVPTARLVDELWGERPPATAAKAVQVHV